MLRCCRVARFSCCAGWPTLRSTCCSSDPQALPLAISAWETYDRLGSPEGELALAMLVIYLGTAPKSNAAYEAYGQAMAAAKSTGSLAPPLHILNAPTRLMKDLGYGKG